MLGAAGGGGARVPRRRAHLPRARAAPATSAARKSATFAWSSARWRVLTSALVTVSESVKQDLVALGIAPAERIRVVPLGLELQPLAGPLPRGTLRGEAGFAADAPLVGMVGRLVPIKDVPTFLRAARVLVDRRPAIRFSLVGDGDRTGLARITRRGRLGLADVVRFHGWRRDLPAVYGDLDVVVNCSRNEGTPVALIEALAAGRPVVATAVGGTPDLLQQDARSARWSRRAMPKRWRAPSRPRSTMPPPHGACGGASATCSRTTACPAWCATSTRSTASCSTARSHGLANGPARSTGDGLVARAVRGARAAHPAAREGPGRDRQARLPASTIRSPRPGWAESRWPCRSRRWCWPASWSRRACRSRPGPCCRRRSRCCARRRA
mgnify:CR=1 FL=1